MSIINNTEYKSLHLLKLCCTFMIVFIHCPSAVRTDMTVSFASVAVPLFFMISGFFLSDDGYGFDPDRLKRRLVRIVLFTVGAQCLYFVWNVCKDMYAHESLDWVAKPSTWGVTLIFGGKFNVALWYLNAYVQSLFVIWILAKYNRMRLLRVLMPVGLVLCFMLGEFGRFVTPDKAWIYSRNALTLGIPCMTIGLLLRRHESSLTRRRCLVTVTLVAAVGLAVETWINVRTGNYSPTGVLLCSIPLAVCIFLLCLKLNRFHLPMSVVKAGRRYTPGIYVGHIIVSDVSAGVSAGAFDLVGSPLVFVITLGGVYVYKSIKQRLTA